MRILNPKTPDMELTLTTPALMFSTLSLLLLAYTNRFLGLASRIRSLHDHYIRNPDAVLFAQISSLRKRVHLIRDMQASGIVSLFLCVACMLLLFVGQVMIAQWVFGFSLLMLLISLAISFWEINISVDALNLHLKDIESNPGSNREQPQKLPENVNEE